MKRSRASYSMLGRTVKAYSPEYGYWEAKVIEYGEESGEAKVQWARGSIETIPISWIATKSSSSESPIRVLTPQNQNIFKVSLDTPLISDAIAQRALKLFKVNGFVVVENACAKEIWEPLLHACRSAEKECRHSNRTGNRDVGRWSFAVAFGSMLDNPAWQAMLRVPALPTLLSLLFPNGADCISAGGDFVIPFRSLYQKLHSDISIKREFNIPFPCPFLCVNFAVQTCTVKNGAMRILPGMNVCTTCPDVSSETEASKMSRVFMSPGDILFRDVRTIHGGTPNLEQDRSLSRFLPSIEFASHEFKKSGRKDIWDPSLRIFPQKCMEFVPDAIKPYMNEVVDCGELRSARKGKEKGEAKVQRSRWEQNLRLGE